MLDGVTVRIKCTGGDFKRAGGQFVTRLAQCSLMCYDAVLIVS